jgi:hypothetical protein
MPHVVAAFDVKSVLVEMLAHVWLPATKAGVVTGVAVGEPLPSSP